MSGFNVDAILAGELEAKWYKVPNAGEARVEIRQISPKRRDRIQEQCTQRKRVKGQIIDVPNIDKLYGLLAVECIVDWQNIETANGPLECNAANIIKLERAWPEFSALLNNVLREDLEESLEVEEDELGNSNGGQKSSSTTSSDT